MARIRTVKPEFWSSPGIETISPWARLLFIAMWNWADDAGRGTCNLKELQSFAFPLDEDTPVATMAGFRRVLAEVRDQYEVAFYKVGGRPYYAIPSWRKHQRNERTAKSRHPGPDDGEEWDFLPPDPPPEQGSDGTSDNFRPGAAEIENASAEAGESPRKTPARAGSTAEQADPPPGADEPSPDPPQMALELGSDGTSDDLRHGAAEAPQSSGPGTGEQGNRGTGDSAPSERGAAAPATEPALNSQTLIAEWLDYRGDNRPPKNVIGQAANQIKKLLDEDRIAYDVVRAGFIAWDRKRKHPSTIPSFVNEAMGADVIPIRGSQPRPSTTDQRVAAGMALVAELEALEHGGPS